MSIKLLNANQKGPIASRIEGGDLLIRAGIDQTENSYISAVLYSYETQFEKMTDSMKKKLIDRIKENVKPLVLKEKWEKNSGEKRYKVLLKEEIIKNMTYFYENFKSGKISKITTQDIGYYEVICQIVKLSDIVSFINNLDLSMIL